MFNLADHIQAALQYIPAEGVANFILLLLAVIFIAAIISVRKGVFPAFVHYTPNLLTSLGILGTFIGIVIGLVGFDVTDIDGSIAPLLDGLMTAFITSLAGMFLAIVFKTVDSTGKLRPKDDEGALEHVGPEDIHAELRGQREAIERLSQSIAGDEDSALISQIRLLRSDQQDHAKNLEQAINQAQKDQRQRFETFAADLWKKLDDFAEMLSKSATEQVINALKEVIADFNQNLTEQFGDNFKELNAAVKDLVQWQENYRQQLNQMNEQYSQGVQAITQTAASVEEISVQTRQIPETMAELKAVMATANHQLQELERHLEAFRDMRDRAVEAVPQIKDQMNQMVEDVSAATKDAGEQILSATQQTHNAIVEGAKEFEERVNRTNEGLTSASTELANNSERIREQLDDTLKDLNERVRAMLTEVTEGSRTIGKTVTEANKQLNTDIKEVQYQVTDSIESMQKRLESVLEEVFQAQTRQVQQASQAFEQELKTTVERTSEAVNSQIQALDEAVGTEIERVMNAMGESLASISNRFTEDYQRLTAQMREVVDQGRQFDVER